MPTLLEQIKAKKAAAKQAAYEAKVIEGYGDTTISDKDAEEYAKADEEHAQEHAKQTAPVKTDAELNPKDIPTMSEAAYKAEQDKKADPAAEVLMGITVEDLQERIAHVFEHAKTAEKHEIKEDMDGLKKAIHSNPSIVQHLLPQDIGKMVGTLRKIHSEARKEAANSPAKKKATQSAETKAAKEMLKRPMTKDELDGLMDEL